MYINFLVQIYFRAFHRTSYDKVSQPFLLSLLMRKVQALLMWSFLIPLPNVHCGNWACFIFIYKMTNIVLHLPWSFSSNLLQLLKSSY